MRKRFVIGYYDYAAYLSFSAYATCSVVIPMCLLPLAQELKFPLMEGGMGLGGALQLGRSIPITLTLLLSGFLAACWGNRLSVGAGVLLMAAGILCVSLAPGYWFLFAALAITGLGEGILEGLGTPFVHDLHAEEPSRYVNFAHSFWSVGVLSAVVLCGALLVYGISWRKLALLFGVLALVPATMLIFPPCHISYSKKQQPPHRTGVWKNAVVVMKEKRFWLFFVAMFFAGGGEFCLTFWSPSFIQITYEASAWAAGVGTALFALGMLTSRMCAGYFVPEKKLCKMLFGCSFGGIFLSLPIPYIQNYLILYLFLFLTGFIVGPLWASLQSLCVQRISGDSTMIFILLSASGIPGAGTFSVLTGVLGDKIGIAQAFYLVPICFGIILLMLGIDVILGRRQANQ